MTVIELLAQNAAKWPDDVALVEVNPELRDKQTTWREYELVETLPREQARREITWREFDEMANRVANLLTIRGVKKGDKVALLMMNSLEWLPIYFGILRSGALVVPLNYRYSADEIKYCLELSESRALIFGPEFIGRIEAIAHLIPKINPRLFVGTDCPSFADSLDQMLPLASAAAPCIPVSDEDDGAIYFSSGTTGFPKAILQSHAALLSACYTENAHHGQTKDDIFLCIPPLYHTGAKMHWFGSLLVGGKGVLLRGVKPEWIIRAAAEEKATIVWLLVPWARDILDAIDNGSIDIDQYDLSAWRLMHVGVQPVPPSLIRRWLERFPHHDYDTNYGLSESMGPGCVHLGLGNVHKVGAIGIPGHGWQIKVISNGEEVPQGEVGELAVKGPGVMRCYFNDEKATNEVLKDGWLYTGDMAMIDEDGFIFLVDRKKDVIITGGENLYPVQIEDFLHQHPAIRDVAVIGLPDARLGEICAAIIEVEPEQQLTEEDVNLFCVGLPRYKRPRKIIFDEVPRNPTGKIEKPVLRKKYCGESLVKAQIES
ncbi:MAG: AMP-binding protein [Firmicutes bacterium]|nr:AMP-binding protein [Bacillota bacterium]